MDWQERISVDPKVLVGKPVIKGTRIAVEFLVELMAMGWPTSSSHELPAPDGRRHQASLHYADEG